MTISRDEWLAALAEAEAIPLEDDPNVLTVRELSDVFGVGPSQASKKARMLVEKGKAERTSKWIMRANSGPCRVPAYRLIKADEA